MRVESIISRVDDGDAAARSLGDVQGLMIHRTGVDHQTGVVLGYTAAEICDAFSGRVEKWLEVAKATGGENPYTFLVGGSLGSPDHDGLIWQALDLDDLGPHGRRWASRRYLGIAAIGDFRAPYKHPPSRKQMAALVSLCALLALDLDLDPMAIVGHGEIARAHGGSKAPGKPAACPGDLLDMTELRGQVWREMKSISHSAAREQLSAAGLVYPS
jgi:hypothetical protein